MAISKTNLSAVAQHNFAGLHAHAEFLNKDFKAITNEILTCHDIEKIQISLRNMRQHIENMELFIAEK